MVGVRLHIPALLQRRVINYAVVICLAMATQFLLNLLTFIGLFGFYYCHRPLCMRYRCIELRCLRSDGMGLERGRAGKGLLPVFELSLALTVDDGRRADRDTAGN